MQAYVMDFDLRCVGPDFNCKIVWNSSLFPCPKGDDHHWLCKDGRNIKTRFLILISYLYDELNCLTLGPCNPGIPLSPASPRGPGVPYKTTIICPDQNLALERIKSSGKYVGLLSLAYMYVVCIEFLLKVVAEIILF